MKALIFSCWIFPVSLKERLKEKVCVSIVLCVYVPFLGRGRQVISVAKTADVILMMLDAGKSDQQRTLLERELESVGIRLNKQPPNIYVKIKKVDLFSCVLKSEF